MKKLAAENLNEFLNFNRRKKSPEVVTDLTFEGWKDVLGVIGQIGGKNIGPSGEARMPVIIEIGEALMEAFELSGPEYDEFLDTLRASSL